MGRSILVEESVEPYIEKLIKANKWFTGVIFGQQSLQRDYVVHIARTPDPVEDEASEENVEEESGDGFLSKQKPSLERPASLDKLDEKWVSTHAKQVSRMLPGGLSIIGLFVLAPTSMLQANQTKSKQMLFSVHKSLSKNQILTSSSEMTDRILLQIDSTTRKLTCATFDVSDNRSTPRPADWKYQSSGGTKWLRLDSHMNLDIHFAVAKEDKTRNAMQRLQTGLADFSKSLQTSIVAVDGLIRDGDELLMAQDKSKGKGSKDKGETIKPAISRVNIFLPYPETPSSADPVTSDSEAVMKIFGKIVIRAFVPTKATVADAVEAVRTDVRRSLQARYELLFEEFDVTDDDAYNQVFDPPVRLFCSLPNSSLDICDYSFQDEKTEEVLERIQDLLDFSVDQLEEVEKSAGEDRAWSHQSSLTCISSSHSLASSGEETSESTLKNYLGVAVGGLVALVAGGISYLMLDD